MPSHEHFNPTSLFVAWQDPRSRGYFPIGRLRIVEGGEGYEFRYTRGVEQAHAQGFRPLIGLDDLLAIHTSPRLFPVFANRVPSTHREDRREYLASFGLDPATAEPFQILAISGDRRATDKLELFPAPKQSAETGEYRTTIFVHGLRHLPRESQERALRLAPGDQLLIMLDLQNPFDPQAIALRTADDGPDRCLVGYLPRYIRSDAWKLLAGCGGPHASIEVRVRRANQPPVPLDQRILCDVVACWPDGFTPFDEAPYIPIVPDQEISEAHSSRLRPNGATSQF